MAAQQHAAFGNSSTAAPNTGWGTSRSQRETQNALSFRGQHTQVARHTLWPDRQERQGVPHSGQQLLQGGMRPGRGTRGPEPLRARVWGTGRCAGRCIPQAHPSVCSSLCRVQQRDSAPSPHLLVPGPAWAWGQQTRAPEGPSAGREPAATSVVGSPGAACQCWAQTDL